MKKIIKISLSILLTIGVAISGITYFSLAALDSSKLIMSDIKFIENSSQINNVELKPQVEKDKEYKIVALQDNWKRPLNPTYSLVYSEFTYNNAEKSKGVRVAVYELKRDTIFDFSYELLPLPKYNAIQDKSFTEATNLASQYDLTKDFPGKSNYKITNYPPLTPEEIESNRKLRETNNRTDIIFKKYTDIYYAAEKEGNEEKKKAIQEQIIPGLQNILNQLNQGKTVSGTNGDIIPDTENKDLVQTSISEFEKEITRL
jgi:hypothetical protein